MSGTEGPESPLQSDPEAPAGRPGGARGCQAVEGEGLGADTRTGDQGVCSKVSHENARGPQWQQDFCQQGSGWEPREHPQVRDKGRERRDLGRSKWRWSGSPWRAETGHSGGWWIL